MSGFGVHRFRWWHFVAMGIVVGLAVLAVITLAWLGLVDGGGR